MIFHAYVCDDFVQQSNQPIFCLYTILHHRCHVMVDNRDLRDTTSSGHPSHDVTDGHELFLVGHHQTDCLKVASHQPRNLVCDGRRISC